MDGPSRDLTATTLTYRRSSIATKQVGRSQPFLFEPRCPCRSFSGPANRRSWSIVSFRKVLHYETVLWCPGFLPLRLSSRRTDFRIHHRRNQAPLPIGCHDSLAKLHLIRTRKSLLRLLPDIPPRPKPKGPPAVLPLILAER